MSHRLYAVAGAATGRGALPTLQGYPSLPHAPLVKSCRPPDLPCVAHERLRRPLTRAAPRLRVHRAHHEPRRLRARGQASTQRARPWKPGVRDMRRHAAGIAAAAVGDRMRCLQQRGERGHKQCPRRCFGRARRPLAQAAGRAPRRATDFSSMSFRRQVYADRRRQPVSGSASPRAIRVLGYRQPSRVAVQHDEPLSSCAPAGRRRRRGDRGSGRRCGALRRRWCFPTARLRGDGGAQQDLELRLEVAEAGSEHLLGRRLPSVEVVVVPSLFFVFVGGWRQQATTGDVLDVTDVRARAPSPRPAAPGAACPTACRRRPSPSPSPLSMYMSPLPLMNGCHRPGRRVHTTWSGTLKT